MKRLSMTWKIFILATLNFVDLVTSLWVLISGVAHELNPLMRWAYNISPFAFVGLKATLVLVSSAFAWANQDRCYAHRAVWVAIGIFALLTAYQLASIYYLFATGLLP